MGFLQDAIRIVGAPIEDDESTINIAEHFHAQDQPLRDKRKKFTGEAHRGADHMQWLVDRKRLRTEEQRHANTKDAAAPLENAWNGERLRAGDCVGSDDDDDYQDQQYLPEQLLRDTWKQIGMNKTLSVGIDGHRKGLAMVSSSSWVFQRLQQRFAHRQRFQIIRGRHCPVVVNYYDCTPARLEFGRFEEMLAPIARYAIRREGEVAAWDIVGRSEFKRKFPGIHVRKGVVELMARGFTCEWVTGLSAQSERRGAHSTSKTRLGHFKNVHRALPKGTARCAGARLEHV